MALSSSATRKLLLQIVTVLLIAVVADFLTDRTFPHHWIVYVISGGLLLILLIVYRMLGPDN